MFEFKEILNNLLDEHGMNENDLMSVGKIISKFSCKPDIQEFLSLNCNLLIPSINYMSAD